MNSKHLYLEGVHWKKGELLGTGAYSSCYAVRDLMTGSLMAVKQVLYVQIYQGERMKRFTVECLFEPCKVKSAFEPRRPIRPALISGFCSMKRLGVFLLPPGWDASPSQGYPQH